MRKLAKVLFATIIMFGIVACGSNQNYDENRKEYNDLIDQLFQEKGFELNYESSTYLSENEKDLSADIMKEEYLLYTQESLVQMDLSGDKIAFSLSTNNLYAKEENDIEETLILSKDGNTKNFVKYKDKDFEETLDVVNNVNETSIEKSLKETMFYITDDMKDNYEVSKEVKNDEVIYTVTLKNKKSVKMELTMDTLECVLTANKDNQIKNIKVNYVMSFEEAEDVYHRTGVKMDMNIANVGNELEIDYSLLEGK